jgi:hypothetical protein
MKLYSSAVIKKKGKWFLGFINGDKFKSQKEVKKLGDVKEVSKYVTLNRYLRERFKNIPVGLEEKILKILKAERCYVLDLPINLDRKQWDKWWWQSYHQVCKMCARDCKQSWRVDLVKCDRFEKI